MPDETKTCPYCAETIKAAAVVCRFCGRDLATPVVPIQPVASKEIPTQPHKKKSNLGMLVIIFFLILAAIYSVTQYASQPSSSSSLPEPTSDPNRRAWTACTLFIEKQLDISYLDAQRYNPSAVVDLGDGMYEVDVYYAKLSDMYKCTILHQSDGNWQLLGLEVK